MKYQVLVSFKAMTSQGEIEIPEGKLITLPHDLAIRLLNESKITPVEKVTYKVCSEILQACLWVVDTDEDMHSLRAQGVSGTIYTFEETQRLKGMDRDPLREIHKVKEVFVNSKIEEVKRKESHDVDR